MGQKIDYFLSLPSRMSTSVREMTRDAKAAARRTGNRIQSSLSAAESPSYINNQADSIAQLLLLESTSSHGEIWFGNNDDGIAMDQDALAANLKFLTEDLQDSYGLNPNSRLLNNSALAAQLVKITRGIDTYQLNLRQEAETVLGQLIGLAARNPGVTARECPPQLLTILRTYNTEEFEDSTAALEARHLALAELVKDIAQKKKPETPLSTAVQDYVNNMPRMFKGSVAEAFQGIVQDSLNDILSNPQQILENSDLVYSPNVLRAYTEALADSFELSIPKALRSDNLVQAAKQLITAFEEDSRDHGATSHLGIKDARSQFVDLFLDRQYSLFKSQQAITKLLRLKAEVEKSIENQTPIVIDDEFLVSGQAAGTAIVANQKNLEAIKTKITKLDKETTKAGNELKLSLGTINKALGSAASPFGEQSNGLKQLWMDRLISDGDPNNPNETNTILKLLLDPEGEEIEFSKLADPRYTDSLNGFKKMLADHLETVRVQAHKDKTQIEANLAALERTANYLENEFNQPLETISGAAGNLIIQANQASFITAFESFTTNETIISDVKTKAQAVQKASANIIHHFLFDDSEGKIQISNKAIEELALSEVEAAELTGLLRGITSQYNRVISQKESPTTINWSELSKSLGEEGAEVISIVSDKIPVTENPNLQYSQEATEEPRNIFNLRRQLDRTQNSLEKSIARAFDYERKAYGEQGAVSFDAAVTRLSSALNLENEITDRLLNGDLTKKIETSLTIGNRVRDLKRRLERVTILTDETHSLHNEMWEREMRAPKLVSAFNAMLTDSFQDLGITNQAAKALQERVEEFADYYRIQGEENGFRGWVEDMLKFLIKYLTDLGLTSKE